MAIAFDAASSPGATFQIDTSWTHTPTGTPRGVLVLISANNTADQVVGVTYGGVTMTEVALSPFLATLGGEDCMLHGFFLGSSIPTGAQTVSIDVSGNQENAAVAITVTAADDTSVEDTTVFEGDNTTTNPSVTLTTSVTTVICGVLHSGVAAVGSMAPGANYTDVAEFDYGTACASFIRTTSPLSSGSPVCDWVVGADEAAVLGVAIREGIPASSGVLDDMGISGFFGISQ